MPTIFLIANYAAEKPDCTGKRAGKCRIEAGKTTTKYKGKSDRIKLDYKMHFCGSVSFQ